MGVPLPKSSDSPSSGLGRAEAQLVMFKLLMYIPEAFSLGLQIAQSRSYMYTLGPKVGIVYILGALG